MKRCFDDEEPMAFQKRACQPKLNTVFVAPEPVRDEASFRTAMAAVASVAESAASGLLTEESLDCFVDTCVTLRKALPTYCPKEYGELLDGTCESDNITASIVFEVGQLSLPFSVSHDDVDSDDDEDATAHVPAHDAFSSMVAIQSATPAGKASPGSRIIHEYLNQIWKTSSSGLPAIDVPLHVSRLSSDAVFYHQETDTLISDVPSASASAVEDVLGRLGLHACNESQGLSLVDALDDMFTSVKANDTVTHIKRGFRGFIRSINDTARLCCRECQLNMVKLGYCLPSRMSPVKPSMLGGLSGNRRACLGCRKSFMVPLDTSESLLSLDRLMKTDTLDNVWHWGSNPAVALALGDRETEDFDRSRSHYHDVDTYHAGIAEALEDLSDLKQEYNVYVNIAGLERTLSRLADVASLELLQSEERCIEGDNSGIPGDSAANDVLEDLMDKSLLESEMSCSGIGSEEEVYVMSDNEDEFPSFRYLFPLELHYEKE